ncbi:Hypothetical predicted protein [Scomber scombrus]|uniref:Uncharacterized protein n=1 Tax=Scomber scombrus TaxID=13677 RepID=A0AAV1NL37_SCOSC
MAGIIATITTTLQQTLLSVSNFVSRFRAELGNEEPRGPAVNIFWGRHRLAVISVTGLLNVMFSRGAAE